MDSKQPPDRGARPPRGATPAGFRTQLQQRLRNRAAEERVPVQRLQQRVAFERFLVRLTVDVSPVVAPEGSSGPLPNVREDAAAPPRIGLWVLKGGFALELRYGWRQRPTMDLDLRAGVPLDDALRQLRAAISRARRDDHFTFELGTTGRQLQGAPGGAVRVPVIARLAGVEFDRFHVDLSSGDAIVGAPESLTGSDLLAFAGLPAVRFPVYPVAQHLAEKLHAYTLPRTEANTRTKDFVDLVVIAARDAVDGEALLASLRATFGARGTHTLPARFPAPDAAWQQPFQALASQTPLSPTTELAEGFKIATLFWEPVLNGAVAGLHWEPSPRSWRPELPRE